MFDRVDNDAAPPVHVPRARGSAVGWFGAAVMAVLTLVACGGGGGDGGVGTNGTGISMGTVNGFGSVIVDGVRFDDRQARVEIEQGSKGDEFVLAEVKLGHRSLVESIGSANDTTASLGVAQRIEVEPSLVGVVDSKLGDSITVLGQRVVVNSTGGQQPATVYEGFSGIADIQPTTDVVEVHALRQGSGDAVTYLATRIEKKTAAPPAYLRIAGVVSGVSGGSTGTFKLGPLTVQRSGSTVILPVGSPALQIANGNSVVVFAPTGAYVATGATAPRLDVTDGAVRVRSFASPVSISAYLSGVVTEINATTKLIAIDGATVDLSRVADADFDRVTFATLVVGDYVRARGRYLSATSFVADRLQLRTGDDDVNNPAELHGTLSGFVDATLTTPAKFVVRDTEVLLPDSAAVKDCPAVGVVLNDQFVEVKGLVSSTGITATQLECKSEVAGSVVERQGTVTSLSVSARTFVLQRTGVADVTVAYTDNTFFRDIPNWTDGLAVEVEGSLSGTGTSAVLNAIKIKRDDD
ncbi:hypothetical protein Lcho_2573 [Leptothrix cholodnii SP-6]|uniref:DUF5666 domain-containing protein n=1 Tax=Leptothrix cholodnii (strain ATCC 51168 / LMG 8142 / SP-6) TaxID=395495 RepID=B1Y783_LEPCP|nr:DUF5666 domain-containing protein [Leptothrix cholodnii]ACB34838.1 hypothetical protein Lcho_2573 [Leptothrix cholodnii SP-6]